MKSFCVPLTTKPPQVRDKEQLVFHYRRKVNATSEDVLSTRLLTNRPLFGQCYSRLSPDLFNSFSQSGGVVAVCGVDSAAILPEIIYPGDIDMLVVPYDDDKLLLHRSLAIEIKIVRAKFKNQSKSPNKFGFSQASSLLRHGFPHAAVVHLITSDQSPSYAWQETHVAKVIDEETGQVDEPRAYFTDLMPGQLIDRTYGRLKSKCTDRRLGLASCYIGGCGQWQPEGREAKPNSNPSLAVMEGIGQLYADYPSFFFDIPRFNPT